MKQYRGVQGKRGMRASKTQLTFTPSVGDFFVSSARIRYRAQKRVEVMPGRLDNGLS